MQPKSIKRFDVAYLASLAVGTAGFFLGYDDTLRQLRAQTAGTGMELGGGFITTWFLIMMAISLLLWWFISTKRSSVAKWILIALTAVGFLGLPGLLANLTLAAILQLVAVALAVVAIYFLFQPDAQAWLARDETR